MPVTSTPMPSATAPLSLPAILINVNTGALVLATSCTTGGSLSGVLVGYVSPPNSAPMPLRYEIGHYQNLWDRTAFREYTGSVTLSNEEN